MEEEDYVPCVCCMMSNQQENGLCRGCNEKGCEEDFK